MAVRLFRTCPNTDPTSLPNRARIKVVLKDVNGNGIPGVDPSNICVILNGGTAAQGYSGVGADSVVANSLYNYEPLCPDVRCIPADSSTDSQGVTYITFIGPGGIRDPQRKWGHFDSELPVFAYGYKLSGRLTSASPNGTYVLRIKNVDLAGGLGIVKNQGERVSIGDWDAFVNKCLNGGDPGLLYWCDFDNINGITVNDTNFMTDHLNHDCDTPDP